MFTQMNENNKHFNMGFNWAQIFPLFNWDVWVIFVYFYPISIDKCYYILYTKSLASYNDFSIIKFTNRDRDRDLGVKGFASFTINNK